MFKKINPTVYFYMFKTLRISMQKIIISYLKLDVLWVGTLNSNVLKKLNTAS